LVEEGEVNDGRVEDMGSANGWTGAVRKRITIVVLSLLGCALQNYKIPLVYDLSKSRTPLKTPYRVLFL
jgi:hypothetical protein